MAKTPALLSAHEIKKRLPKRPLDSHKGNNGHALIIAGSRGMSGAAVLAARGALRIGAGLVTVAIVESERSVVTHQLPEVLTLALPETPDGIMSATSPAILRSYVENRRVNALAIGPGLSHYSGLSQVVKTLINEWEFTVVLDADALNNLSLQDLKEHSSLIITPHPGELAHLLQIKTDAIQRERVRMAENVARDYDLLCVLKGHHSVITDGKNTRLNPTGNPAMATGGVGDVLTGVIAGLLAQELTPWDAACAGVYVHGLAGDLARVSDRGLLATEIADALPKALAKIGVK